MALLPTGPQKDVFSISFDGAYGRFKTAESYELAYLQTSLRPHELSQLVTASEAFDFRAISFDEIIQRDIDMERVDNELVKKYLEAGHHRVLFFPPILVSIVALNQGKPVEVYDEVVTEPPTQEVPLLKRTWDKDKFQLELNVSAKPTGHHVQVDDKTYNYIPYAATVRVNPETVKLVVIDGQHRFTALRRILDKPEKKYLLADMTIPVCIFFTPDAVKDKGQDESIKRDLRDLFVTINSTAKEVSGHFLILLNDKSLSSLAVRSLADQLKGNDEGALLPLLEWNTREASKARQRQKPFSITTIATIADCFKDYIFKTSTSTQEILALSVVKEQLKVSASSPAYNQINEETFGPEQTAVLNERLLSRVTPSLSVLFTELRPYARLIATYKVALTKLDQRVAANTAGAKSYRDDVLFKFRRSAGYDYDAVKTAEREFESGITIPQYDEAFFLTVFQQGLIRAWATLSNALAVPSPLTPVDVARTMLPVLNRFVFSETRRMLERSNSYLQLLLFEGERIRVNDSSRTQWVNLILATFVSGEAQELLRKELTARLGAQEQETIKAAHERVVQIASRAVKDYVETLDRRIAEDFAANWQYKNLGEELELFLRERQAKPELHSEYEEKLQQLTEERGAQAKVALSNVLGLAATEL